MNKRILTGDALAKLRTIRAGSVQMCVTSPPYWGLRDYGTAKWEGGDPGCDHKPVFQSRAARPQGKLHGGYVTIDAGTVQKGDCRRCGATRVDAQLGLEKTPEEYVQRMVEVFREVRRTLKDDGTLWLNLGDSYAGGGNNRGGNPSERSCKQASNRGGYGQIATPVPAGLKPKDLVGIPWMVAFALRADGWYLRSDIIWHKSNPMPESVTDRPTKSHEYLFLLAKSERYFYDADAVKEPFADERMGNPGAYRRTTSAAKGANNQRQDLGFLNNGAGWNETGRATGRNRRSVWTIATRPYKGAHFATFPPKLIEPCILAGSRPGDTVLDPFAGAGTTGLVALQHGRKFLGIELNPAYVALANERLAA